MNAKLTNYLNGVFAPYDGVRSVADLKNDLLSDLEERYADSIAEGMDEETAFKKTIGSIGDIDQTILEVSNLTRSLERQVHINLTATDLQESDFAGVKLHKGKFKASALRGADFTGADLTGSVFKSSNIREAKFDGANLTDCTLSANDLANASFDKSILARTSFNASGMDGTTFADVRMTDVTFSKTDLRNTAFDNCVFDGVTIEYCDMRGMRMDGLTFTGVKFDRTALDGVSFKGAVLKNVSFRLPFSVTNKSYMAFKTASFDGATMDKLTYAGLKGMWVVDLSNVTVI